MAVGHPSYSGGDQPHGDIIAHLPWLQGKLASHPSTTCKLSQLAFISTVDALCDFWKVKKKPPIGK